MIKKPMGLGVGIRAQHERREGVEPNGFEKQPQSLIWWL
jgi:hypothetical protein